jgi:secreted trypsin-like serine protease
MRPACEQLDVRVQQCAIRVVLAIASTIVAGCENQAWFTGEESQQVVGGHDADIKNFPWQVSLRENGGHFCGGSILNERWVLSAAHCLWQSSPSRVNVLAGVTRRSDSESGQLRQAKEIYIYAGFAGVQNGRDASLIELENPLDLTVAEVKAIPIVTAAEAAAGSTAPGVKATVSGWGQTSLQDESPDVLQYLEMPIVADQVAEQAYGYTRPDFLPVATDLNGEDKSPCYGDSGGPLVVSDSNGVRKLAGIVSWGDQNCTNSTPAIFGRVSAFESWIKDKAFSSPKP